MASVSVVEFEFFMSQTVPGHYVIRTRVDGARSEDVPDRVVTPQEFVEFLVDQEFVEVHEWGGE